MDARDRSDRLAEPARTIVVGLGNPLLGDDGVGWCVAEDLQEALSKRTAPRPSPVDIEFLSIGGLGLMEHLIGYRRAVLVDAITSGRAACGTVSRFPLEALPDPRCGHSSSAHDVSLRNALLAGRAAGAQLPEQITVVAIEIEPCNEFSEDLTPPVAAAVPDAVRMVLEVL